MRGQHADSQRCCFVQSRPHLCCRCVPVLYGLGYFTPSRPAQGIYKRPTEVAPTFGKTCPTHK